MSKTRHLVRMVIAYVLACLVAVLLAYTIVRYGVAGAYRAWDLTFGYGALSVVSATITIVTMALLPATAILLFAEYFQIRSLRFYAGIGVVASVLVVWVFTGFRDWGGPWFYPQAFMMAALAFIGGACVYWAIAGRHAGWKVGENSSASPVIEG